MLGMIFMSKPSNRPSGKFSQVECVAGFISGIYLTDVPLIRNNSWKFMATKIKSADMPTSTTKPTAYFALPETGSHIP